MKRLSITLAALLVLVAALASSASAGLPYRFTNRAATEKALKIEFVKLALQREGVRYTVRSIGCAKAGVGRARCALVVSSRRNGTETIALDVDCPNDSGRGCSASYMRWLS